MGCRAITPHLVGLAGRLEDKPFHLVAAHCQRDTRENVVAYLQSKGLPADTPNFTVTNFGGHPKVKGNGYVPYYMVFDHRGELVHHHMGGRYHGGDGLKMIELVDELLADAPAIYLGDEPYEAVPELAAQVADKRLPGALRTVEERLAGDPAPAERAELERLRAAIASYRDRMLARADELLATEPAAVVPALDELADELERTSLAAPVEERLDALRGSADLRVAEDIARKFEKAMRKLERRDTPRMREKAAEYLEEVIAGHEHLPIAKTVRARIATLRPN